MVKPPFPVTWVTTSVVVERAAASTILANPSKPPIKKTGRIRSEKEKTTQELY